MITTTKLHISSVVSLRVAPGHSLEFACPFVMRAGILSGRYSGSCAEISCFIVTDLSAEDNFSESRVRVRALLTYHDARHSHYDRKRIGENEVECTTKPEI